MLAALLTCSLLAPPASAVDLPMSGEVTASTAIVQTLLPDERSGESGRFELATSDLFAPGRVGERRQADGVIVRDQFSGLEPDTRHFYRWRSLNGRVGRVGEFRTLPGPDSTTPVSFVVVTGLNYARFHGSDEPAAVKALGPPMLEAIRELDPSFAVFTGDTVYYDTPVEGRAETREGMRAKWHENFVQPRFREFLANVPVFHMKDDHDFRKDDADRTGDYSPSPELGIDVFREQVPVVPAGDDDTPTYRTVRCNRDLQLWFVEGRDYRSPNKSPDGPDKTIWGEKQYQWLTRTLKESDATFKVLVSPTPLVGPDDKRKRDNHTNVGGFRHERDRFFDFLQAEGMLESGEFLILCGDRHWQYHATDPSGVQEFSSGAIHRSNARGGRLAGDPQSTDPEGRIVQRYLMGRDERPDGGFLSVRVQREEGIPQMKLSFLVSEDGGPATREAYSVVHQLKYAEPKPAE